MRHILVLSLLIVAISTLIVGPASALRYDVQLLGGGVAVSINSNRQIVVGDTIWNPDGSSYTLAPPPGDVPPEGERTIQPVRIIDSGSVYGSVRYVDPPNGTVPPGVSYTMSKWGPTGAWEQDPRRAYEGFRDVNNLGQMVGCTGSPWSYDYPAPPYYDPHWTAVSDVAGFAAPNTDGSYAYGMNNTGAVVGSAYDYDQNWYQIYFAYYWSAATGFVNLANGASATEVNDSGHVVGHAQDGAAMWYGPTGTRINMNLPSPFKNGSLVGINSAGGAIGNIYFQAFYWSAETGAVEFFAPSGYANPHVNAINNSGVVVGSVQKYDPLYYGWRSYAAVWTPVPEPSSLADVVFGLALAIRIRRRG